MLTHRSGNMPTLALALACLLAAFAVNVLVLPGDRLVPLLYAVPVLVAALRLPPRPVAAISAAAVAAYLVSVLLQRGGPVSVRALALAALLTVGLLAVLLARQRRQGLVAADQLQRSEERYRTLVTATAQLVWTATPDGKIRSAIAEWSTFTGLDEDEIRRDGWLSAIHPEDREHARRAWSTADKTRAPYELEYRVRRNDGVYRHFLERAVPILERDGAVREWVGTCTDITEHKRAEAEREELLARAEDALALRDRFLSLAAHELKTPLTSLKAAAQLMERQTGTDRQPAATGAPDWLGLIRRQVGRMERLIAELLDASRIGGGILHLETEPFDLGDAVVEVVDEFRRNTPNVQVRLELSGEELCVLGDRERIQQVVANLLSNAGKYSASPAVVFVRTVRFGDRGVVTVTDRGIGVPDGERDRIFEPYYRATNVDHNNYNGLGLGLYLARSIVNGHGGAIRVEPAEVGGSTFRLELPLADSTAR